MTFPYKSTGEPTRLRMYRILEAQKVPPYETHEIYKIFCIKYPKHLNTIYKKNLSIKINQ